VTDAEILSLYEVGSRGAYTDLVLHLAAEGRLVSKNTIVEAAIAELKTWADAWQLRGTAVVLDGPVAGLWGLLDRLGITIPDQEEEP